ncbi:nuclease (SNase domain protein) [Chlorobium limicola DSM 245]|uniref:Nuclease (SNase domain protein) n=1 Tax=Chlorobium limicola (strain DSM 245 / NBRC 103803 / 6330) TaxID=290315 RepID=B3ED15_CHLL2|nr:thermonuclease family protein [Chlorobium limicola]ACD90440.1 nuclease (SNase domain protein) [Chlorobium limicola DSM 245]
MSMLFFRNRLCLFILPFLFLFAACNDASESAKVVRIADGDTITILHADNTQERIRLYGIDCPEKSQSFGNSARKFTGSLVFGKQASIRSMDRDKYGRTVAWVYVGEKNVNEELVRAGYAWHYRQHSNDAGLRRLEHEARKAKRGLWSESNPVPPWEYRQGVRYRASESNAEVQQSKPSLARAENKASHSDTLYHGNVKNRKFHLPGCSAYNCKNCTAEFRNREKAIEEGYEPCRMCNP